MQKDKMAYIVALIAEFAKRFGITDAEAAQYMNRYHATALCDKHYGIMHTLSFADNVDSIATYCRRQGRAACCPYCIRRIQEKRI